MCGGYSAVMSVLMTSGLTAGLIAAVFAGRAAPMALEIHIVLEFSSPAPKPLVDTLEREAAGIWKRYGVALDWNGTTTACDATSLAILTHVNRSASGTRASSDNRTLGTARVTSDGMVAGPIELSEAAVEAILAARSADLRDASFPALADRELGRALGRVLAHEIGHILLASLHHPEHGLMRARFFADELVGANPLPFRLTDNDVARLRHRLPVLKSLGVISGADDCETHRAGLLQAQREPTRDSRCPSIQRTESSTAPDMANIAPMTAPTDGGGGENGPLSQIAAATATSAQNAQRPTASRAVVARRYSAMPAA